MEEQLFRVVAVLNLKNRRFNILATISVLIIYYIKQEVKSDNSAKVKNPIKQLGNLGI